MKRILVAFFLFISTNLLFAQSLELSVSTLNTAVNERVIIQYAFDGGNLPEDLLPQIKYMLVVGGPSIMQGSNTINGVSSSTSQLTYEVIFTKPGKYLIPAAAVKTKKGRFESAEVTIQVVKGNNSQPIIPPGYEGKELFIVMEANKQKAYVGEPIAIDLTVYSIFNNVSMAAIDYPTFDGGWTQDATDAFNERLVETVYKGRSYYKCVLRRVWMVPSITGNIEFKPVGATFNAAIQHPTAGYLQFTFKSKSEAVKFDVMDLPTSNKPVSFTNAMGEFSWTMSLDKNKAKANEPIKAIVKINGIGNLPVLEAPLLEMPNEFEVFEPNVKNNYKIEIKGINGVKQFEYLIMPRKEGDYWLGPFIFSFFNPVTKKYTELKSDSFQVSIHGIISDTTGGKVIINNGIFNNAEVYKKTNPFFGNPLYYALLILPFLAGLGMIVFRKRLFFTKRDDSERKLKLAEDQAYKTLEIAHGTLVKGNGLESLGLISGAFHQYICDKFKTSKNEVTRTNLSNWLSDASLKASAIKILDQMDQFRFAPAAHSDLDSLYKEVKNFVDELGKK